MTGTTIFNDPAMLDDLAQYQAKVEMEAAYAFAIQDMRSACQDHGFYASIYALYEACTVNERRTLLNAVRLLLENNS